MKLLYNIKNDFKLIKRDKILVLMLIFIIYLAIVLRFLIPWLDGYLIEKDIYHDLSTHFPLIIAYMVIFTGVMMLGGVYAFLTLDDKDDGVIMALMTTPISPQKYLMKRLVMSAILGFVAVMFLLYVVNVEVLPLFQTIYVSLGAALTAPLYMVFLVLISKGKVQGMSYGKIISFLAVLLIVAWFIKEPFEFIIGIFPPYWISKGYWTLLEDNNLGYIYVGIGILFQLWSIKVLVGIFTNRIYKEI